MRWKKYIYAVRISNIFKKDLTSRRKFLNNAALKIQSVWRGFKARQKYKEKLVNTQRRRIVDQVRKLDWLSDADKNSGVEKLKKLMNVGQIEAVFCELKEKAKCNYSRVLDGSIFIIYSASNQVFHSGFFIQDFYSYFSTSAFGKCWPAAATAFS